MIPCIHKTTVFCGCALPGGGFHPRWEGILWMRTAGRRHLSTLGGYFVDRCSRRQWFLPETVTIWGQSSPPAVVSPGKIPFSGTKVFPLAPLWSFLPETVTIWGQSSRRQWFLPETAIIWGYKSTFYGLHSRRFC